MAKAFIDGQAGTTGLGIRERLMNHPGISLLEIDEAHRKDAPARVALMDEADVVFLCLPDAAAREAAALVSCPDTVVIDASTAHRVQAGWTYGLAELAPGQRDAIAASKRIANPGCYATGFIAAARPLVELGLVDADYPFTCVGLSGYSGAGKAVIADYESADRPIGYDSPRAYALSLGHKHLPEMAKYARLDCAPVFSPVICDFYQGMAVHVPLICRLMKTPMSPDALRAALGDYYAGHRLIEVLPAPEDGFLPANLMAGQNGLKLFVTGNADQIEIISVFDNLGKGASGAAVQNMNLALGFDEYTSLI